VSKINIPRLTNISKLLATESGNQLQEFITYSSNAFEQIIRSLKGSLTFEDNFSADKKTVVMYHNTNTTVLVDRVPDGIIPLRVLQQNSGIDSFDWFVSNTGQVVVNIKFTDAPVAETRTVNLLILY